MTLENVLALAGFIALTSVMFSPFIGRMETTIKRGKMHPRAGTLKLTRRLDDGRIDTIYYSGDFFKGNVSPGWESEQIE